MSAPDFQSPEHEKAWMIRVTINACKDLLRSLLRRRTVSLDEVLEQPAPIPEDHREVLEAVLSLPVKYKDVVYLHYYEGYTASQIGEILGKKANTVYTLLTRARQMLKEKLGEEMLEVLASCPGMGQNAYCYRADTEQMGKAQEAGLPCGKYQAFLEWQALDPEATVEQARTMTMSQLRQKIAELSGESQTRLPVGAKARTRAKVKGKAREKAGVPEEAAEKENREDDEKTKKVPSALICGNLFCYIWDSS